MELLAESKPDEVVARIPATMRRFVVLDRAEVQDGAVALIPTQAFWKEGKKEREEIASAAQKLTLSSFSVSREGSVRLLGKGPYFSDLADYFDVIWVEQGDFEYTGGGVGVQVTGYESRLHTSWTLAYGRRTRGFERR